MIITFSMIGAASRPQVSSILRVEMALEKEEGFVASILLDTVILITSLWCKIVDGRPRMDRTEVYPAEQ